MILDLSNPVSLMRLRCGDTRDLPLLTDEVYESALQQKKGNVKAASILCAQYILATLAFKTHSKMMQLEVWGAEAFKNYKEYLVMVVKDPDFSGISPIPFSQEGVSPITKFQKDWDKQYSCYNGIGDL